MKHIIHLFLAMLFVCVFLSDSYAMELPNRIILKTNFKIWQLNLRNLDLISDYQKVLFDDFEIKILENQNEILEEYLHLEQAQGLDIMKLKRYLDRKVAPDIFREREDVIIDMDEEGNITFEGNGLYGRELDVEKAAIMIINAVENDIKYVNLPVIRYNPEVTILSDKLKEIGIKELVAAGESNFSGSARNRIHNINVGLSKFNGHTIEPNGEFVFGEILGYVSKYAGFLPELVIKGDRTVPELGGGLCQVSTTSFRAALDGGFKITKRTNHSYAVHYYDPVGLDATVYPPSVDFKFINDDWLKHLIFHLLFFL